MLIVETPVFTRRVTKILDDEQYRLLQRALLEAPDSGRIIPGSGGLRKLRWAGSGRGKRGGVRLVYYWFSEYDILLMLFLFAKNEQADLTTQQRDMLRRTIEKEYHERKTL